MSGITLDNKTITLSVNYDPDFNPDLFPIEATYKATIHAGDFHLSDIRHSLFESVKDAKKHFYKIFGYGIEFNYEGVKNV